MGLNQLKAIRALMVSSRQRGQIEDLLTQGTLKVRCLLVYKFGQKLIHVVSDHEMSTNMVLMDMMAETSWFVSGSTENAVGT